MKKIERKNIRIRKGLFNTRTRVMAGFLAITVFFSVCGTALNVYAEEISDIYHIITGDPVSDNAFDYALFEGDDGSIFNINANSLDVTGDVHSNGGFIYRGNAISVTGDIETGNDNLIVSVSDPDYRTKIGNIHKYTNYVEMPQIVGEIKDEIRETATVYGGYTSFNNTVLSGDMIVNGDVGIYSSICSTENSVIVATGNIQMGLENIQSSNEGFLFMCSEKGNIQINAMDSELNGILYAPNGYVMITGNLHLNGRIIAKQINYYGSNLTVTASEDDLSVLDCLNELDEPVITCNEEVIENHVLELSLLDNDWISKVKDEDIEWIVSDVETGESLIENTDYFVLLEDTNKKISIVFLNEGTYEISANIKYRKKEYIAAKEITVNNDETAVADCITDDYYLRDENGKANINITDMSFSPDGDNLGVRSVDVYYDVAGSGLYGEFVGSFEFDVVDYSLELNKVGQYRLVEKVSEELDSNIKAVYEENGIDIASVKPVSRVEKYFEIGNRAPESIANVWVDENPNIIVICKSEEEKTTYKESIDEIVNSLANLGYESSVKYVVITNYGDDDVSSQIKEVLNLYDLNTDNIYLIGDFNYSDELSLKGIANIEKTLLESGGHVIPVAGTISVNQILSEIVANQKKKEEADVVICGQNLAYSSAYMDYENDPLYDRIFTYECTPHDGSEMIVEECNEPKESLTVPGEYTISIRHRDNPVGNNDDLDSYRMWSEGYIISDGLNVVERPLFNATIKQNDKEEGYTLSITADNKDLLYEVYVKEIGQSEWIIFTDDLLFSKDKIYLVKIVAKTESSVESLPKVFVAEYEDVDKMVGTVERNISTEVLVLASEYNADYSTLVSSLRNKTDYLSTGYFFGTQLYEYNQHLYFVPENALFWDDSKEACERMGGHLVTISSQGENDFVKDTIIAEGKAGYLPLGFSDAEKEREWKWVTGEEITYTNWTGREPNNGNGGAPQNHAYMYSNGGWDDGWDYYNRYYMCEWDSKEELIYGIENYIKESFKFENSAKVIVTDFDDVSFNSNEIKAYFEKAMYESGAEIIKVSDYEDIDALYEDVENLAQTMKLQSESKPYMVGDDLKVSVELPNELDKYYLSYQVTYQSFDNATSNTTVSDNFEKPVLPGRYSVKVKAINKETGKKSETDSDIEFVLYDAPGIDYITSGEIERIPNDREHCVLSIATSVYSNRLEGTDNNGISGITYKYKKLGESSWTEGLWSDLWDIDSIYLLYASAEDNDGIVSNPFVYVLSTMNLPTEDVYGPSISIIISDYYPTLGDNVEIKLEAVDENGVESAELYVAGDKVLSENGNYSYFAKDAGNILISAIATDNKGNVSTRSETIYVKKGSTSDVTPPEVHITRYETDPDNADVINVYGSVSDDKKLLEYRLYYSVEGKDGTTTISNGSAAITDTFLGKITLDDEKGSTYVITLSAKDASGNENYDSITITEGILGVDFFDITMSEDGIISIIGSIYEGAGLSDVVMSLKGKTVEKVESASENNEEITDETKVEDTESENSESESEETESTEIDNAESVDTDANESETNDNVQESADEGEIELIRDNLEEGVLCKIDSTLLKTGEYTLTVNVKDIDGNEVEGFVIFTYSEGEIIEESSVESISITPYTWEGVENLEDRIVVYGIPGNQEYIFTCLNDAGEEINLLSLEEGDRNGFYIDKENLLDGIYTVTATAANYSNVSSHITFSYITGEEITVSENIERKYPEISGIAFDEERENIVIYGNLSSDEATFEIDCVRLSEEGDVPVEILLSDDEGIIGEISVNNLTSGDYRISARFVYDDGTVAETISGFTYKEEVKEKPSVNKVSTNKDDVVDPSDSTPPTVDFLFDIEGNVIVEETGVYVSVNDDIGINSYSLEYRLKGSEDYTTIALGKGTADNLLIGNVKPDTMLNGIYEFRLVARDFGGNEVGISKEYNIYTSAKIGFMSIGFVDYSKRIGSMNLQAERIYSNLNKYSGDFGYGWNLSLSSMTLKTGADLWNGYVQNTSGNGLGTVFYISETTCHDVVLNMGDGTTRTFKVSLSPESQSFRPITSVNVGFKCKEDPKLNLSIIGDNSAEYSEGLLYWNDESNYNSLRFLLTDNEGNKYTFNTSGEVEKIENTFGETIYVSKEGFVNEEGKGLHFVRDDKDRITSISDDYGQSVYYNYDEKGNLSSFVGIDGVPVNYEYDKEHNLTAILDSEGRIVARSEYDENGRLIASIDAEGNRITYEYDPNLSTQKITDRRGNSTVYYYDAFGLVTKKVDAYGNVSLNEYDDNHNLIKKTDENGKEICYQYDEKGKITGFVYPGGVSAGIVRQGNGLIDQISVMDRIVSSYIYDSVGQMTSVTDANGNKTDYTYDANGNTTSISDMIGTKYRAVYDDKGDVLTLTLPNGSELRYTYNEKGECVSITNVLGDSSSSISFTYDERGNISSSSDALGNTKHYTYDLRNNLVSSVNELGDAITYTYDIEDRLIKTDYPDGSSEYFAYDNEGNLTESVNRLGLKTSYEYDKLNRIVKTIYPTGKYESYTYDAVGNILTSTSIYGDVTTYYYDDLYRNIKIESSVIGETTYEYDYFMNLVSSTDALGNKVSYEYDNNNNLTTVTMPDGNTRSYEYDSRNRLIKTIDGYGKSTVYTYDNADLLTSVTDADGNKVTYEYDVHGNLSTVTDGNNQITKYIFDDASRLVETDNALGQKRIYEYDAMGRIIKSVDQSGYAFEYSYDTNGNVILEKSRLGETSYAYQNGMLKTVFGNDGATTYTYNNLGLIESQTDEYGNLLNYTYDSYGNVTKIEGLQVSENYSYDEFGRLVSVTDEKGKGVSYTYDTLSRINTELYTNGIKTSYTYDSLGRVSKLITSGTDGSVLASYEYTYGKSGELLTALENYTLDGEMVTTLVTYTYSDGGKLLSETHKEGDNSLTQRYTYDAAGNRIKKEIGVTGNISKITDNDIKSQTITYTYNAINQLVAESKVCNGQKSETTYTYDANGNLIKTEGETNASYRYDYNNRLIEATAVTGDVTKKESYHYDASGVRNGIIRNGIEERFVTATINGLSCLFAKTDAEGNLKASYLRGNNIVKESLGDENYYYSTDALGDVRCLVDETGAITDSYRFDSYGMILIERGDTDNPYGYRGEEIDELTGFVYLRARYMNPNTGSFISEDTFGGYMNNPVTMNRYTYANNNPVGYIDPSGNTALLSAELMAEYIMDSLVRNQQTIYLSTFIGGLISVVDASLTNSDIESALISGMEQGFAWGVLFAMLGPLSESIGAFKAFEMTLSAAFIFAGYVSGMQALKEGQYDAASFRFGLAGLAMLGWGCQYGNDIQGVFIKFENSGKTTEGLISSESGSECPDLTTGVGYDASDPPVRVNGEWTINDMKQALLGHAPRGLRNPDIHHGGQMPGGSLHEVLPNQHRNNSALHPNIYNQGITNEMRISDRQLHWWYRAREQGADELLPDWIYDN